MTRRPRRTIATIALAVAAVLALAACGTSSPISAPPEAVGEPAQAIDADDTTLPPAFDDARVVDPGWELAPQSAHGAFLSLRASGAALEFIAVDETGEILWTARRPQACAGFVVTTVGERAIAVLMDLVSSDETLATATASGYDLRTGETLWGPVPVPGPLRGPGLVFAAPPEGFMGELGPSLALDPATGRVIADERELDPGTRILGAFGGTALLVDADALLALRTDGGDPRWRLPLADHGWSADRLEAVRHTELAADVALLGDDAGGYRLIDLADGAVLAAGLRDGITDEATGVHVVLGDALAARSPDGDELWRTDEPISSISAVGGGIVYAHGPDGLVALDLDGGTTLDGATTPDAVVPRSISPGGAGVVGEPAHPLLVTAPANA